MNELDVGDFHFIAQQDGDIEREFLANVSSVIEKSSVTLSSAFLCRVHYGNPGDIHVALCMASLSGDCQALLESISTVFRETFGSQEHLDLLFLNEEQEKQIHFVCNPFYTHRA